jgi:hypothetical protein
VTKLLRTLVFVRPALLVVEDVIEVDAADTEVTWAAHVTTKPTLAGNLASAIVGGSRVDLRFIEGGAAPIVALREPTPSGEGPHRLNKPWGPMWRIEQPSPTGTNRRRFLSVISAAGRAASAPPVKHVVGVGIGGATIGIEGRGVAVLFYQGVDGEIALGRTDLVVVAGLTPRQRYRLTFVEAEGCKMTIRASEEAGSLAATAGGFVRVKVKHCHTQR